MGEITMPKIFLAGIAVLTLFCGCLFEPYRETLQYDLVVQPVAPAPKQPMQVLEFRNDSSAGLRMQQRFAGGQVVTDPYCRWILSPGALVSRALNTALALPGVSEPRAIGGTIEIFEVDARAKLFRFAGTVYQAPDARRTIRFDLSAPLADDSAEAIAAAAAETVRRLALLIAETDWPATEK